MSKLKKIGLIVFSTVVLLTAGIVYIFLTINDNMAQLELQPIQDVDLTLINDGLYEGEYEMFPIHVIVHVGITNHEISEVMIVLHQNGQGDAAEAIIDDVILEQSIEVDSIAGATYSSKAILLAIQDALINASQLQETND